MDTKKMTRKQRTLIFWEFIWFAICNLRGVTKGIIQNYKEVKKSEPKSK